MQSSVPQYIDVEDKIVGPFTWKHLGWLCGMGVVLLVFYSIFDFELFMITGAPVALVFLAFAFYRPSGMPMTTFVFHGFFFLFRPKVSLWERPVRVAQAPSLVTKRPLASAESVHGTQVMSAEKLKALAAILDRRVGTSGKEPLS